MGAEINQVGLGSEDDRGGLGDHLGDRGPEDHPGWSGDTPGGGMTSGDLRGAGRGGPPHPQPGGQNAIFEQ